MKAKKASQDKQYFLKNTEGFLFTHLFASGSIQDKLVDLLKCDAEIRPVSLSIELLSGIRDHGKSIVYINRFPDKFPGKTITLFPLKETRSAAKKSSLKYDELLIRLFEPVGSNISHVLSVEQSGFNAEIKTVDLKNFPVENDHLTPCIKYHLIIEDKDPIIVSQYMNERLLDSLSVSFLGKELVGNILANKNSVIEFIRDINKRFQLSLISSIESAESSKISISGTGDIQTDPAKLNLEELRLAPDTSIRILLDTCTRKQMPVKTFVFAVKGMSEELRAKFMSNMSRNRRNEVRDGMRIWEPEASEIMQAQKELAWVIIELGEKHEIKISKRLQRQLEAIIRGIDNALAARAEKYIESDQFGSSISEINNVILQLLIRRVPRKVLIPALSVLKDNTSRKISYNMTEYSWEILKEDIKHWDRGIEDKKEKITSAAAAQQAVVRTAGLIKREFARSAF